MSISTVSADSVRQQAIELEALGYWVVPIHPSGATVMTSTGDKIASGKEPIGKEWGLARRDENWLRAKFRQHPGAGAGICFGPGRGPGGTWLIDLEGDGDKARDSLDTVLVNDLVETIGWSSTRGCHTVFTADGDRLLAALAGAGASESKEVGKAGVWHLPELPDLEFRIGGLKADGKTVKQVQSVVPPTPGTDGNPREWTSPPAAGVAVLPESAYTIIEAIASARCAASEAEAIKSSPTQAGAHNGNGKSHDGPFSMTMKSPILSYGRKALQSEIDQFAQQQEGSRHGFLIASCIRLASLVKAGALTEGECLAVLKEGARSNAMGPGRFGEIDDAWHSGYAMANARDLTKVGTQTGTPPRGSAHASSKKPTPQSTSNATDSPIVNRAGFQVSCLHNSLLWLAQNGYGATVRYDRFRQTILVNGNALDDTTVIAINAEIEASTRSAWSQEHVRSAMVEIGRRNEFSSLTAWLDSLKWDGVARLDKFFQAAYGVGVTDYTTACAKVLFISGVARAYQPGCQADVMVVLIGRQGLGKSMGIASLCPDPAWYADDLGCDLFDRKAGEGLRGKWLIEFSEFSRINRATLDVAKAFVSRRSDYYRPAYGRMHKDYPRTCVFIGTTNDDHPLHDRENRRFMPVRCVKADTDWIASTRDQLWAEAAKRYRDGEKWWVTVTTLLDEVASRAEEARQGDSWEEILHAEIGHQAVVTMKDAAERLKIGLDRLDKSTQTRIGIVLRAIGYTRHQVRNGTARSYEWRKDVSPPVTPFQT